MDKHVAPAAPTERQQEIKAGKRKSLNQLNISQIAPTIGTVTNLYTIA